MLLIDNWVVWYELGGYGVEGEDGWGERGLVDVGARDGRQG